MNSLVYFDNAATSWPKPKCVINAVEKSFYDRGGNPGRSGHILSINAANAIYSCRETVCKLLNYNEPERVIFTYNTTYALNLAIKGFVQNKGKIIISNLEHNSVLRPVHFLANQKDKEIKYNVFNALGSDEDILRDFESQINEDTHLAVVTMASNVCGKILPVSEISKICKKHNVKLVVDAAQSGGCVPMDFKMLGADCICFAGHKSLYGPQGTGFCVFSKDIDIESFVQGGNGVNSLSADMTGMFPEKLEAGTLSTPCISGLDVGIRYVLDIGINEIYEYGNFLTQYLVERLENMKNIKIYGKYENCTPCVSFNKSGVSNEQVSTVLSDSGICTRSGFHCSPLAHKALKTDDGAVRVSFSYNNTKKQIDTFLKILERI